MRRLRIAAFDRGQWKPRRPGGMTLGPRLVFVGGSGKVYRLERGGWG